MVPRLLAELMWVTTSRYCPLIWSKYWHSTCSSCWDAWITPAMPSWTVSAPSAAEVIWPKLTSACSTMAAFWFRVCWEAVMLWFSSPARDCTSLTLVSTSPARDLISSASFFTWAATTAKPRPSWPARAASMEALMARISVCSTMETIFSMER